MAHESVRNPFPGSSSGQVVHRDDEKRRRMLQTLLQTLLHVKAVPCR